MNTNEREMLTRRVLQSFEIQDTESILRTAGFVSWRAGTEILIWRGRCGDRELAFQAHPWIHCWRGYIKDGWIGSRNDDEFTLPESGTSAEILRRFHSEWRRFFPKAPMPEGFRIIDMLDAYRRDKSACRVGMPCLEVDMKYLKFLLKRIHDRITGDNKDDCYADTITYLSFRNGQMQINGFGEEMYCPAVGLWVGTVAVSFRELMMIMPRRSMKTIVLKYDQGAVTINSGNRGSIAGLWSEGIEFETA